MKNTFAQNFKQLRTVSGERQEDVARALNTTQRKISYWEKGQTEPDIDALIEIAEHFDVSIDELVGRTE